MNIYLVERTDGWGFDDFDSFIAVAPDEEYAKSMIPRWQGRGGGWPDPEHVKVICVGEAVPTFAEPTVLCASFNAG